MMAENSTGYYELMVQYGNGSWRNWISSQSAQRLFCTNIDKTRVGGGR